MLVSLPIGDQGHKFTMTYSTIINAIVLFFSRVQIDHTKLS